MGRNRESVELTKAQASDFAAFTFGDLATRPQVRGKKADLPLAGKHICRPAGSFRGSDRVERIFLAFTALKRAGFTTREASLKVAEQLKDYLGTSNRGRKRTSPFSRSMLDAAKSVVAMAGRFRKQIPDPDQLVDFRIGTFLFLKREKIVVGSAVVPNSGQAMMESYLRLWKQQYRR